MSPDYMSPDRQHRLALPRNDEDPYQIGPSDTARLAVDPHDRDVVWTVQDGKLCYKRQQWMRKDWLWCEYPATLGSWSVPPVTLERCKLWLDLLAARPQPGA